jgi:hypothetical protein
MTLLAVVRSLLCLGVAGALRLELHVLDLAEIVGTELEVYASSRDRAATLEATETAPSDA